MPTVHADEVASKVAVFYEQIRTIIDWKEEHLMRRAAIIRKLKRRFLDLELSNSTESLAEPLVLELVRGGYFPNDKIETEKTRDIQKIIEKYIFIFKNLPTLPVPADRQTGNFGVEYYNQLLEIASCEIEETLAPSIKEMALIDYMFSHMQEKIKINENLYAKKALEPEDKNIQIYIAVQQALFKLDEPIIRYNLLQYKYPYWNDPSEEELLKLAQNMYKILDVIGKDLEHPMGKKFYAICEKYDTPYLLLGDILAKESLGGLSRDLQDPALMEGQIRSAYLQRLSNLKKKIRRAAVYSTISIFITKILSLLILQIILAQLFRGHLGAASLAIDILIPTLLMAVLVTTIKPPSKKNLSIAVMETMKIAYGKEKTDAYEIKGQPKRGLITRSILSLMYLMGAIISFGAIYWGFASFGFPLSSIIINMIFIALILFAGNAIRERSRELSIEEESTGVLLFVSDILLLPIMGLGRWMSNKWKRYNAIVVFFNVLIDMPFSAFIEFLERYRYFIKDKKEDMR